MTHETDTRPLKAQPADPHGASSAEHLDALLEEALMETFPASDPIAFSPFRDR